MSRFDLVPVDGGEPIHLPLGDTVLGRGPLLGVSDKRVSRHHGLLENLNGQLRLKPTHLNPCFVQSSLSDDPRPLQKDTWFPLGDGDLFSLLPGQFIYRVVAVGGEEATPRNSQMFEEEENKSPIPPSPDVEPAPSPVGLKCGQTLPHEGTTQAALSDEANRPLHQAASVFLKDEEAQTGVTPPTVYRKRILPGWMMAATSNGRSSSSKVKSAVKRSKGPVSSSAATQRPAAKQTTPPLATLPKGVGVHEEEKEEEEKRPKKRRRKVSDEEVQATTCKEERDDLPVEEEEEEDRGRTLTANRNATNVEKKPENTGETSQRVKPVGSNSSSVSGTASSKRLPCPYGKDCYRKNPIHFQECSHPGDPDYKEEEEDEEEEADRPECPYGTDCYRKNPLHKKEFKHTKRPARTSRTVAQKPQADDDEDDDGEDDDSFINDDSEDLGDDSDYMPPDSDDSGKEEIKRLQKEAKVFLKRRK
ncbi:aprataxin and PNK-like factor isoform X2 [Sphaeramia orbicularis]|uniref:aprataxin and PNK-like factor isoform X2 n=1 Tax=Sphaeramia orbicularis TaxID=375764 RepID=UPI001180479C|nr:aprataxin and PNK-like factor isoform X2 [Sphaeramia orbicularis]